MSWVTLQKRNNGPAIFCFEKKYQIKVPHLAVRQRTNFLRVFRAICG